MKKIFRPTVATHISTETDLGGHNMQPCAQMGSKYSYAFQCAGKFFRPHSCACFGPDLRIDNRAPHTDSVHAECGGVVYTDSVHKLFRLTTKNQVISAICGQKGSRAGRCRSAVYMASLMPSGPRGDLVGAYP